MVFGSWSHTSSLIHYKFWENKPELPQYTPNNEWKLLAVTQSIKTVEYPNWVENDPFFEINFTILIVRKPLQAIYNTVVPALMLTTLTLVSFFVSQIFSIISKFFFFLLNFRFLLLKKCKLVLVLC
jgi:hypothetical protein